MKLETEIKTKIDYINNLKDKGLFEQKKILAMTKFLNKKQPANLYMSRLKYPSRYLLLALGFDKISIMSDAEIKRAVKNNYRPKVETLQDKFKQSKTALEFAEYLDKEDDKRVIDAFEDALLNIGWAELKRLFKDGHNVDEIKARYD